jgi:hypothetical protein
MERDVLVRQVPDTVVMVGILGAIPVMVLVPETDVTVMGLAIEGTVLSNVVFVGAFLVAAVLEVALSNYRKAVLDVAVVSTVLAMLAGLATGQYLLTLAYILLVGAGVLAVLVRSQAWRDALVDRELMDALSERG